MPFSTTTYRVFIASPSDMAEARQVIVDVLESCNRAFTSSSRIVFLPRRWEDNAAPDSGDRPQEIINRQLVQNADLLIGVFGTRFGSKTGIAESGTEEEIQLFLDAKKRVLLYFSETPTNPYSIDPDQFSKVKDFRKRFGNQGLYFDYTSLDILRKMLNQHLISLIQELTIADPQINLQEVERKDPAVMLAKEQFLAYANNLEANWITARKKFDQLEALPEFGGTQYGYELIQRSERPFHDYALQMHNRVDDSIAFAIDSLGSKAWDITHERAFYWGNIKRDGEQVLHEFWIVGEEFMDQVRAVRSVVIRAL